MKEKSFRSISKALFAFAVALLAVIVINAVPVNADNGKTVRVSTAKELKAALKKADVGTVIFRTQAYIDVTIKANKAAKEKSIIVDAPNANIVNKATFAHLNIQNAQKFTEAANGNHIDLSARNCNLVIAKNKTVAEINFYSDINVQDGIYSIRKGGKVEVLNVCYDEAEYPQWSEFDADKRLVTITFNDNNDISYTYYFQLDKAGRILSIEDAHLDPGAKISFKYNKNGDIVKRTVEDGRGVATTEYEYCAVGKPVKVITTSDDVNSIQTIEYDTAGNPVLFNHYSELYSTGADEPYATLTGEYDADHRITKIDTIGLDGRIIITYKYNKKGFRIEAVTDFMGGEYNYTETYKYNKKGDLIKSTFKDTNDGSSSVYEYTYDEFGELIDTKIVDPTGKYAETD